MKLGQFSVSLAVKNIAASRDFYQKLGYEVIDDHQDENWLIMRHGEAVLGLFQGMFDNNIMTFNPRDVRAVQKALKSAGVALISEADPETEGPAHVMLSDPDGNVILLDQHPEDYKPNRPGL